jgi:bla regulator protein BlaR1
METILYNISQVLGITIIHSLWQGLIIYFILRVIFTAAPSLSAVKKYNLAIAAIVSISICFIYTLFTEAYTYNWVNLRPLYAAPLVPYLSLPIGNQNFASHEPALYHTIAGYMPYISILYIAGLMVNLVKLSSGWNKVKQIKQSVLPAEQMQQYINSIAKRLDINKFIQVKFSEMIDVPCVTGFIKPIIFLPVSIATSLTACEIESILLHELSHIKRKDYLINIMQQFITVILFFNPFAQLINRVINRERENGCDDMVIERTENPLIYAHALLKLEETRQQSYELTLSATGKRYHLLNRIERIMKTEKNIGSMRHLLVVILLFAGSLSSIAWFNPKITDDKKADKIVKTVKSPAASNVVITVSPEIVSHKEHQPVTRTIELNSLVDSNKSPLADTNKHNHKERIVIIDKYGNRTEYDSKSQKDSLDKFYSSPEWKSQMEAIRKQSEEIRKQFNNPEWKSQMDAMRKQGEEIKKQFNSPEWKNQMFAMRKQGEEIKKQFNSPEWKAQMDAMKNQGDEIKKQFSSPEWKTQMDAMKKQGEEIKKQFDSPEWKTQMDAMKKQGEEMKKQFSSPEWKTQMDAMKKQGEEIKKQFNSPEWKAQMDAMKKQGEEIKKQFDSPEWKKSMHGKWILKDSTNGARIYVPAKPDENK